MTLQLYSIAGACGPTWRAFVTSCSTCSGGRCLCLPLSFKSKTTFAGTANASIKKPPLDRKSAQKWLTVLNYGQFWKSPKTPGVFNYGVLNYGVLIYGRFKLWPLQYDQQVGLFAGALNPNVWLNGRVRFWIKARHLTISPSKSGNSGRHESGLLMPSTARCCGCCGGPSLQFVYPLCAAQCILRTFWCPGSSGVLWSVISCRRVFCTAAVSSAVHTSSHYHYLSTEEVQR